MPLRLNGATSGYIELAAPAIAGTTTLTLPTDSIQPALILIASQSFTAQSSLIFNNCFTSSYQNYRLVFSGTASTGGDLRIKLRAAGTDSSVSYYTQYLVAQSTTVSGSRTSNVTTGMILSYVDTAGSGCAAEIYNPAETVKTYACSNAAYYGTIISAIQYTAWHDSALAYDGFSVSHSGGTITGNFRVYGYRN